MANFKKFTSAEAPSIFFHNSRGANTHSNPDIDKSKSDLNYRLEEEKEISSYQYFKQRKEELYCYNRADVKTLGSWIVTAPDDLPQEQERLFFETSVDFLNQRYGKENCCEAIVHYDEGGKPHLHYLFIPATEDKNASHNQSGFKEKICCAEVVNRKDLQSFHSDFQKFIDEHKINATVNSGVTARNGRNYSVKELKLKSIERKEEIKWTW